MSIVILGGVLVVCFVITWIVIATNSTEPLPRCCLDCLHTHSHGLRSPMIDGVCCNHFGIGNMRKQIGDLQEENSRLRSEMWRITARPCLSCISNDTKIYACSLREQELTDLLKSSAISAKQLHDNIFKELTKK